MTKDVPIIIPSHGRAGAVVTLNWLPTGILCVAERQAPAYRAKYPDAEIDTHPDDLIGLIPKRQWIYERYGDCFMVDDDVIKMVSLTTPAGQPGETATGEHARALIERLYDEATDLGAYLFGFSAFGHPLAYNPMKPFSLTGIPLGAGLGIRKSDKLFWNTSLTAVGDYWIGLLNAHHHRMALIDWRWYLYPVKTFKAAGGAAGQRTMGTEQRDNEILQATFGSDIVQRKRGSTLASPTHGQQRSVRLPF